MSASDETTRGFLARLLEPRERTTLGRTIVRVALGVALTVAGVGHLTFAREEFQAQVPPWLPLDPDLVVVLSGIAEITLGGALVLLAKRRVPVGWAVALFFVAVFPGNIGQWLDARDGFGLDSDGARFGRLFFQPLLVAVALWSTAAWRDRPRATEPGRRAA
ncbi:putative membrane protein [Microterricola gilva]|uniref:Putative membrane protein n=1 Tax=Microterricola gilva TaxID=393267 RepID=A0A4Q8AN93_9MICO|nr:DoxX family membrane protein [Microterricola gilva]RZU66100.1 putative membrane protein [Microterricola gilva]